MDISIHLLPKFLVSALHIRSTKTIQRSYDMEMLLQENRFALQTDGVVKQLKFELYLKDR